MRVTETPEPGMPPAASGHLPQAPSSASGGDDRRFHVSAAELKMAAILIVVLALVGLLVGLIWAHVAPRALYTVVDVKHQLAEQNNPESEAQVGTDGWFALIGAGVGLVTGFLAWQVRAARGAFIMVALAAASLLSAVIAWRFGLWVGRHPTHAQLQPIFEKLHNTFRPAITMRAKGVLFFQPVGAVLAAVLCAAFTGDTSLRGRRHRGEPAHQPGGTT
jgi:hypothetical protein